MGEKPKIEDVYKMLNDVNDSPKKRNYIMKDEFIELMTLSKL